jgi:cytochrome o ubiquinol oxidase operon protein cyoD
MAHATSHGSGASHGTLRSYLTGFVLAVLLTGLAFGLVMSHALPTSTTFTIIFVAAAVQMLVHLRSFLHLDASSAQRWNLAALAFTVVIIVLVVGGSVWIMFNLRGRMMAETRPAATQITTSTAPAAHF